MHRTAMAAAVLTAASLCLAASGCSGDTGGEQPAAASTSEISVDTTIVQTKVGSVARPSGWKPLPDTSPGADITSFAIDDGGTVVGQMDVIVSRVAAGSPADVVSEAFTTERLPHFENLRSRRRDFRDVPGAESAFVEEHTYTTAQGEPARSVDQLAVAPDGGVLLVRISAAQSAFDRALFGELLASMQMKKGQSS